MWPVSIFTIILGHLRSFCLKDTVIDIIIPQTRHVFSCDGYFNRYLVDAIEERDTRQCSLLPCQCFEVT
jgi:hypothetical protein